MCTHLNNSKEKMKWIKLLGFESSPKCTLEEENIHFCFHSENNIKIIST